MKKKYELIINYKKRKEPKEQKKEKKNTFLGMFFKNNKIKEIVEQIDNISSITYKNKDNWYIRDSKIGKEFNIHSIYKRLSSKKEKKVKKRVDINLEEERKNLIPPEYIDRKPVPAIIRLLIFFIRLLELIIKIIGNSEIYTPEEKGAIIKYKEKVEDTKNVIEEYGIKNIYEFRLLLNKKYKEHAKIKKEIRKIVEKGRAYKKIVDAINKLDDCESRVKKLKIREKDLLINEFDEIDMRENMAKLDPIDAKTKTRLFYALKDLGFIKKYNNNLMTQEEAKEICEFLEKEEENRGKIPNGLCKASEYKELKREKQQVKFHSNKWNYINYNKEQKEAIKDYRSVKTILKLYSIEDKSRMENIIYENNKRIEDLKKLKNERSSLEKEITKLNNAKEDVEGKIFENINMVIDEKLAERLKQIKEEINKEDTNTLYDYLEEMVNSDIVKSYENEKNLIAPPIEIIEIIEMIRIKDVIDNKQKSNPYEYTKEEIVSKYIPFFKERIIEKEEEDKKLHEEAEAIKERVKSLSEELIDQKDNEINNLKRRKSERGM